MPLKKLRVAPTYEPDLDIPRVPRTAIAAARTCGALVGSLGCPAGFAGGSALALDDDACIMGFPEAIHSLKNPAYDNMGRIRHLI